MKTIYCISGLGADETAFSRLSIPGYALKVIPWLEPRVGESIQSYALRMSAAIAEPEPILMGLSFGGMVCQEIARLMPVSKLILISSIRSRKQMPLWMRLAGRLRLNRVVPIKPYAFLQPFQNSRIGAFSAEEKAMVERFRRKVSIPYLQWSVDQILNWRSEFTYPELYHIHGSADKIFPVRYCKPGLIIPGGSHLMIMNKPEQINALLRQILPTS